MAAKKPTSASADAIAAARQRAAETRRQLAHKPSSSELLTPEELAAAAPFYFVLRAYVRQLKEAREADGITLAELSSRCGLAVESLSRLETGAQTNPTWKTLGLYASALGFRPRLTAEAVSTNEPKRQQDVEAVSATDSFPEVTSEPSILRFSLPHYRPVGCADADTAAPLVTAREA